MTPDEVVKLCEITIQEAEDLKNRNEKAEEFAESVLEKLSSIKEWVEVRNHVTEKQADAVVSMSKAVGKWIERL